MKEINVEELLSDIKLTDILNQKGKEVLLALSVMCKENGDISDVNDLILDINEPVRGKPWLYTILAIVFWLDELLKANPSSEPSSETEEENKKFDALIGFIEWELIKKSEKENKKE